MNATKAAALYRWRYESSETYKRARRRELLDLVALYTITLAGCAILILAITAGAVAWRAGEQHATASMAAPCNCILDDDQ